MSFAEQFKSKNAKLNERDMNVFTRVKFVKYYIQSRASL